MPGLLLLFAVKFIPLILGSYYWRSLSLPYKLAYLQVIVALCAELTGWCIAHFLHKYNLWVFNIYRITELLLLGMAAFYLFQDKQMKRNVILLIILSSLIWIVSIYKHGILVFDPLCLCCVGLILVIIYLMILFKKVWTTNDEITKSAVIWLCLSVIIFYCCIIPYYGLFNYLNNNHRELSKLFLHTIVYGLNYVRYPLVGFSFYLLQREKAAAFKSVRA